MRIARDVTDVLQQAEVLEVARAHLQAVHVGMHHLAVGRVHDLGERFQAVFLTGVRHDRKRLFSEALERVRVRARLERAAADPREAEARDAFGHLIELLLAFHRAGAGEQGDLVGAGAVIRQLGCYLIAHTDGVSFITFRMLAYISRRFSLYRGPSL